jgi:hypothetical protein
VADKRILLKFHYAPHKVTAATLEFIKPPLTEVIDRLTFNPELIAGYQVTYVVFTLFGCFTTVFYLWMLHGIDDISRMMSSDEL